MEINEDVSVKKKVTGRDNFLGIWSGNLILFILLSINFQVFRLPRPCQKADRANGSKIGVSNSAERSTLQ